MPSVLLLMPATFAEGRVFQRDVAPAKQIRPQHFVQRLLQTEMHSRRVQDLQSLQKRGLHTPEDMY